MPYPYGPPTFNLTCNIWRNGNPTTNPPDVVSPCNLALGRRSAVLLAYTSTSLAQPGGMWLLLPAGTDIRDLKAAAGADTVEVGAGSGRFYSVEWVDDAGGGFTNEHRFAEILGLGTWPTPFPRPASAIPPTPPPPVLLAFHTATAAFTDPITITPSAGQLIVVGVTAIAGTVPTQPTLSSSLVGPITNRINVGGVSIGSDVSWTQMFWYVATGGSETLTVSCTGKVEWQWIVVAVSGSTLDASGFSQASGSPFTLATSGPTVNTNEYAIAFVTVGDLTPDMVQPAGWTRLPTGFDLSQTISGITWDSAMMWVYVPVIGTPSGVVTYTAGGGAAENWIIGTFT